MEFCQTRVLGVTVTVCSTDYTSAQEKEPASETDIPNTQWQPLTGHQSKPEAVALFRFEMAGMGGVYPNYSAVAFFRQY